MCSNEIWSGVQRDSAGDFIAMFEASCPLYFDPELKRCVKSLFSADLLSSIYVPDVLRCECPEEEEHHPETDFVVRCIWFNKTNNVSLIMTKSGVFLNSMMFDMIELMHDSEPFCTTLLSQIHCQSINI
jgi:hypothetical protein